jgi:nifR3 family TIM-barrel protein
MNFWYELKEGAKKGNKPFFALAPMADVTDPAFRQIITKYGKPDVLWTEFVSADGLMSEGREVLKKSLEFSENERPIVAQIFSSNPERMRGAAKLCAEMGFDGIDINMGCPDKSIEKQGSGAAMINNKQNAVLIIQAVKDGIADATKNNNKIIPISVKTRVGYNKVEIDEWIPLLLQQNIDCLTVHARTRRDLSKVPANWNYIKQIVDLKNKIAPNTVIIGNGDVVDTDDGNRKCNETGCDGIMIGRAIFGNPWLFSPIKNKSENNPESVKHDEGLFSKITEKIRLLYLKITGKKNKYWLRTKNNIPLEQKLNVMVEHAYLFEKMCSHKNFAVMKKHFKAYANGFPNAKELRINLMENANSAAQTEQIVQNFLKTQNLL